jgi:pimeloyl-ACP methyl ester carboxylesterase
MRLPFALLFVVLLAACGKPEPAMPSLALTECRVPGIESAVRCATLEVPEDRANPGLRRIPMHIVVIPATSRSRLPDPIFFFAGGPSQAASDFARHAQILFGGLNSRRDIVLVDQRGTGKSNGLFCKMDDPWETSMLDSTQRVALGKRQFEACRIELSKKADLRMYTTSAAMADIDAVREALGYAEINLWGGSYGTRAAQEYLRRYPDRVRSVVLDGVAPPSLALPANFSADAAAALQSAQQACARDPACEKLKVDFRQATFQWLASLKAKPIKFTLADPFDGRRREVLLDDEAVLGAVFSSLYAPEAVAMLPNALAKARAGDFGPLVAMSIAVAGDTANKNAMGMRLSVMCAEDVPRLSASDAVASQPFGELFVREFKRSCEGWPIGTVLPDFHTPVKSAKPVLILSGGIDPVTPPRNGDEVKLHLSNAKHLVAPNVAHGVSGKGCAPKLVKQFIEKASVVGISGECLARIPRPTFFEPYLGKPPVEN